MHACIHTYMHTCMHAYIHACIHTYILTCMHACMHASRSDLINPDSPFGVAVTLVSCCLLLYTAIIVQMEIGFVSLSLSL